MRKLIPLILLAASIGFTQVAHAAGAKVVDEAAVTDGNIVTSRKPDDVEAFTNALIDLIQNAPEVQEIREPSELPA